MTTRDTGSMSLAMLLLLAPALAIALVIAAASVGAAERARATAVVDLAALSAASAALAVADGCPAAAAVAERSGVRVLSCEMQIRQGLPTWRVEGRSLREFRWRDWARRPPVIVARAGWGGPMLW